MSTKTVTIKTTGLDTEVNLPENLTSRELAIIGVAISKRLRAEVQAEAAKRREGTYGEQQTKPVELNAPHKFESGAVRSEEIKARYDLIPAGSLERLALRYGLGAQKYGEYNWQKGMPFSDTYNHIIAHLEKVKIKYETGYGFSYMDDDLAGAAWGCLTLMFFETRGDYIRDVQVQHLPPTTAERQFSETREQESQRLRDPKD